MAKKPLTPEALDFVTRGRKAQAAVDAVLADHQRGVTLSGEPLAPNLKPKSITDLTWKESALIDLKVLYERAQLQPLSKARLVHMLGRIIAQVEQIQEAP